MWAIFNKIWFACQLNNIYISNTASVWNTSKLVFKSAHLASCALLGRLYNWAGFLILVANGQSGDDASGYVHVSFKIGSDKERVLLVGQGCI